MINLGLVYKVQHHSGVIFQFVAFIRKRRRTVADILAAGGRYDHLVGFTVIPQSKARPPLILITCSCLFEKHGPISCSLLPAFLDPGVSWTGFHRTRPQRSGGQCRRGQSLRCYSQHGGASERHRHTLESDVANYYNEGAADGFIFNDGFIEQSGCHTATFRNLLITMITAAPRSYFWRCIIFYILDGDCETMCPESFVHI